MKKWRTLDNHPALMEVENAIKSLEYRLERDKKELRTLKQVRKKLRLQEIRQAQHDDEMRFGEGR